MTYAPEHIIAGLAKQSPQNNIQLNVGDCFVGM
jgi:hypothetical protein